MSTDIGAIGYNNKIAIRAMNNSIISSYFTLNNGTIDLDFYFAEDDPRNGIHVGAPITQPNGQIYIRFGDLSYQQGDTLTFIATELLPSSITKHYVIVRGDYFPESGGPITTCPRSFTCDNKGFYFYYDPGEVILDNSSKSPLTLIIPGANITRFESTWAIIVDKNAIGIKALDNDCSQIMGIIIMTINGITCTFENGQLQCPPWVEIPDNLSSTCAPYFQNCALDLIDLLSDVKYTLPCSQWVDYNQCTTTSLISREGNVAIGTSNFAENAVLSVKNGIITDKVKVINIGWADYVFDPGYSLMPLEALEAYIAKYHHLPDTPSAEKVEAAGSFELGETTINHQVKIEEIFLHLIELEEETKALESVLFLHEILKRSRIK